MAEVSHAHVGILYTGQRGRDQLGIGGWLLTPAFVPLHELKPLSAEGRVIDPAGEFGRHVEQALTAVGTPDRPSRLFGFPELITAVDEPEQRRHGVACVGRWLGGCLSE